jgi:hypothetical protein
MINGQAYNTFGANLLSEMTGLSREAAELLYGAPAGLVGIKPIANNVGAIGKVTANEVSNMSNATKYAISELGKDIKSATAAANNVALNLPNNKYVIGVTNQIEKGANSLNNYLWNLEKNITSTPPRIFLQHAAIGGGITTGVESLDYIYGDKPVTSNNIIDSGKKVAISFGLSGLTANTGTLGTIGVNVGVNTAFSENKDINNILINPIASTITSDSFGEIISPIGVKGNNLTILKGVVGA